MATSKLASILAGLKVGASAYVDARSIGVSTPGFHAVVTTWVKNKGGPGFEVVGEPHKNRETGLYDKVRLRRLG